ncbi:putative PAS/PAC sensor protein [Modestobacter italicus]|uniref:PAS/PAC sensor protein n=1 Tax=Modestobacter italicus (strain DSM 44449 / CECT 9708 / BC 501) TaxID=2732864 RepID=I4F1X4_MODI5|nr:SpoIIE family protein phosphatase [Modestobacter marinus]CCH89637.1 putative PAS/PAC sensor protein [Modestobacter marinus]
MVVNPTPTTDRRSDDDARGRLQQLLEDDPADLFENAPCGYLSTLPDGTIIKVNRTLCTWIGHPAEKVLRVRLRDLLSVGGQVFHDTHLTPLLRMQGAVREVALDVVRADGSLLPCLVNAVEVHGPSGEPVLVRVTLFEATARRRYERETLAARRAAEESEARSRTLQQFTSELAAAVTTADAAAVVVHRSRRAAQAAGAALWVLGTGAQPGAEPAVELAAAEGMTPELLHALSGAAPGRVLPVLGSGVRTVPVGDALRAAWPELAAAADEAGCTDLVVVPVSADDDHLGALVLARPRADESELISLTEPGEHHVLTEADADLLATLGQQAGQAIERARLHEETARQAERSAFLLDAARLLARATGVTESVERLAEMVVPRLADMCLLDLVLEHGMSRVVARHGDPARQEHVEELRAWAPPFRDLPAPARAAMEEGRTRWYPSLPDEWLSEVVRDPAELAAVRALELASVISVPLVAEGRALGVMTLSADRRRAPFTAADVELAEQLALQVSLMMAKAQRFELEARTSHTLQATLLPPSPPRVPGVAVAVRYLAATYGVEIGGDFYDVAPLPGDHVAIAVGDVVGHDITAAATMGQLRSVYRSLLVEAPAPTAVIDRLQASWPLLGLQRMATALFATLDLPTGVLHVASAGHPPPLLVVDGHAEFLPVVPSRMLGAPPAPAVEWTGVLPPGATLVLFTDGLVESRTSDIDAGLARLQAAAGRRPTTDPDELCDRLLGDLAGTHRADDIALLALTRDP